MICHKIAWQTRIEEYTPYWLLDHLKAKTPTLPRRFIKSIKVIMKIFFVLCAFNWECNQKSTPTTKTKKKKQQIFFVYCSTIWIPGHCCCRCENNALIWIVYEMFHFRSFAQKTSKEKSHINILQSGSSTSSSQSFVFRLRSNSLIYVTVFKCCLFWRIIISLQF